jgi:hypothetical protein
MTEKAVVKATIFLGGMFADAVQEMALMQLW